MKGRFNEKMTDRMLGIFEPCDAWLEAEKVKFLRDPKNKALVEKLSCGFQFTVHQDFYDKVPIFLMKQLEKNERYYFTKGLWVEKYGKDKVKLMQSEEF